jgi:lipopolysaccharide exporter
MSIVDLATKPQQVPGHDVGKRTLTGSLWILGQRFYRQLLFLINAAVLGRLLGPHDFGLVGLGALAIQVLEIFTYTGFGEALVQRTSLDSRTLYTAWWIILGRATVVALLLFLAAPLIARMVHEPAASRVLQVLAAIYLMSNLASIGGTLLYKEMRFNLLFRIDASAASLDLLVAVVAAFIWRNVWALVLGAGIGALTRVILSYVIYPIKPRLVFDKAEARKLFSFGQWLLASASVHFISTKGTDMLSGFLYGTVGLGLYQMASRFALLPTNHIGETFFEALFPAYSHMQADPQKLRGAFLKTVQVATAIIFLLSTLMAVVGGPIIFLIMGPKWEGVVPLVPGLALGGALQALTRTAPPLLMATGKPKYHFLITLNCAAGMALSVYPLYRLGGIAGLPWAYALGFASGLPLWWRLVRRQSQASSRDLVIALGPAVLGSLILAIGIELPMRFFQLQLTHWGALAWLVPLGIVGVGLYLSALLAGERFLPSYQPVRGSWGLIKGMRPQ